MKFVEIFRLFTYTLISCKCQRLEKASTTKDGSKGSVNPNSTFRYPHLKMSKSNFPPQMNILLLFLVLNSGAKLQIRKILRIS